MVRECTLDDVDFLIELATRFNDEYYGIPLNPDKLWDYMWKVVQHPDGVALRTDHGAIIGMFAEDPFRDWTALIETGWYSTGRDGLQLLKEFEKRGKLADEVRMSTLETNPKVVSLLHRRGYASIETSHRLLT